MLNSPLKSYPPHIIEIIKLRRKVRKKKKKQSLEERSVSNTEYNRLTGLLKKAIKEYTEKRWSLFLGKLGPYPASSSIFWRIINKARAPKTISSIPTLVRGDRVYKTDEEKAELFRSVLGS